MRGLDLLLKATGSDYYISPKFYKDGSSAYLDGNDNLTAGLRHDLYIDQAPEAWTFTDVTATTGIPNSYQITNGGNYLHATPQDNYRLIYNDVNARSTWQIVSKAERIAVMQQATQAVEASWLIGAPDFSWNDSRNAQWILSDGNGGSIANFNRPNPSGPNNFDICNAVFETWNNNTRYTNIVLEQTVSGLPNGRYTLSVQGTYSPVNSGQLNSTYLDQYNDGTIASRGFLFAGSNQVALPSIFSVTKDASSDGFQYEVTSGTFMAQWVNQLSIDMSQADANDYFRSSDVSATVTNGTLHLGVKVADAPADDESWMAADNFKLMLVEAFNTLSIRFDDNGTDVGQYYSGTAYVNASGDAVSAFTNALNDVYNVSGTFSGQMENLKVTGEMHLADLQGILYAVQNYGLTHIDLSGATLVGGEFPAGLFQNDGNIVEFKFPSNVTTIADEAFANTTALQSVEFPTTLTTIGHHAFAQNGGNACALTSVTFRSTGALTVGDYAFEHCLALQTINVAAGSNITFGEYAFQNILDYGDNPDYKGNGTALTTLTIGDGSTVAFSEGTFQGNASLNVSVGSGVSCSEIPDYTFNMCENFTNSGINDLLATGVTRIGHYAFFKATLRFTEWLSNLVLPATVAEIGDAAFGLSPFVTIHVNRATAPTITNAASIYSVNATTGDIEVATDQYGNSRDPFAGMNPNHSILYFDGDAATGWRSYLYTSGTTKNLPWARLLTRDLYTSDAQYDAYPQQHAFVRLHRTLKAGWNTLCLPFGANYAVYQQPGFQSGDAYNTRILQQGLNVGGDTNFMIAAYRGYNKSKELFRYLKYANYDDDPMDAFETFLVRMGSADVSNAPLDADGLRVYTFANVDLNYEYAKVPNESNQYYVDASHTTIYNSPDPSNNWNGPYTEWNYNVTNPTPVKAFNGEVNTDVRPFSDGESDYADYIVQGSYKQFIATAGDEVTISSYDPARATGSIQGMNNETVDLLFDGYVRTKYCCNVAADASQNVIITYDGSVASCLKYYQMTTAGDASSFPDRNPYTWTVEGSNDNTNWTVLDTQTAQSFSGNNATNTYSLANNSSTYRYYRLNITAIRNNRDDSGNVTGYTGTFQLAEWRLMGTIDGQVSPITSNDAFIQYNETDQKNYFYWCKAGNRYGVRGFCGWFHYVGTGTQEARAAFMPMEMAFFDDEVTEIVGIDADGQEHLLRSRNGVYSLDGRQLRSGGASLEGLPKGLYIVDGKKVVVK